MTDPRSATGSTLLGFLAGFTIAALVALVLLLAVRAWRTDSAAVDLSRPAIVRQVQQLQRLQTVVFGLDKIVPGGQESRYLPRFLAGDRLLLMVYGEVTAGVDLSGVEVGDATVEGSVIRLTIPAAEIFSTRIDNERTRVYSRETGLFSQVDPNLESEVRRASEQQIRQAALDQGILQVAADNARLTLNTFLNGLGFEEVEIR